ncbi:MAG: hypothetical protein MZU97_10020 [Bacillus subtilis]|nr:hypothetical protein [Bacillus subtilis]
MHASYALQLELKTAFVTAQLAKQGLPTSVVLPAIGMKDPYFYRTKAQMTFSEKGTKILAGFYEENTHRIVNVDRCFIQNDQANQIVKTLKAIRFVKHKIKPYQEDKETGLFRHVDDSGRAKRPSSALVTFVTSEEKFPGRNNVVEGPPRSRIPRSPRIVQNVNPRKTSVVLGDFERVLHGPGFIEDEMLGLKLLNRVEDVLSVSITGKPRCCIKKRSNWRSRRRKTSSWTPMPASERFRPCSHLTRRKSSASKSTRPPSARRSTPS